jgi:hypothetical protein
MPVPTVTFVQGEQLSISSLSMITPPPELFVLSAHARTEYVPVDGKLIVAGEVEVSELPFRSVAIATAGDTSAIVPPPLAAVAVWKKLEKPAPVDAVPLLVIVETYA